MNEGTNFFASNAKALVGIAVVSALLVIVFSIAKNRAEDTDKRAGETTQKTFEKLEEEINNKNR